MGESENQNAEWAVLRKGMGGGPHGLGDPDDKSLRKVEKNVMIPQKMKVKAKKLCDYNMRSFAECSKLNGLLMPFKCRTEAEEMRLCLVGWYEQESFVNECTKEYLEERTEYRRTGVKTPFRKFSH